jgi:hypothetical protein
VISARRDAGALARAGLLLFAFCLVGGRAAAQDDPLGPSPDEQEKLEICPQLADATGRRRDQLEALYFDLTIADVEDPAGEDAALARELFDLGNAEDTKLLAAELTADGSRCLPGLQAVLRAHGANGLLWLLERLAETPAPKRGRVIAAVAAFDEREAWSTLLALLTDLTPIPNARAAAQAPPGYQDLRVCDHALRALAPRLRDVAPAPDGIDWRVEPLLPIKVRDQRIAALRDAASKPPLSEHVAARPLARDALADAARARLDAALKKLGG